jgi:hypothetical protein
MSSRTWRLGHRYEQGFTGLKQSRWVVPTRILAFVAMYTSRRAITTSSTCSGCQRRSINNKLSLVGDTKHGAQQRDRVLETQATASRASVPSHSHAPPQYRWHAFFWPFLFYELTYLGQKLSLVSYMAIPLVLGLNGVKSSVKWWFCLLSEKWIGTEFSLSCLILGNISHGLSVCL